MTAQATAVNVTATATVMATPCSFRGVTLFSTTGATVTIYDNTSAAGTVLAKFTLAAGGSTHLDIADGVRCAVGIHLVATAAVDGSVRVG